MSRRVVLRPAPSDRRQPFLQQSESHRKVRTRLGEAVGGTAAVCCCCPCGLANIMYLAIYKVPASLCLKALKRKRRRHLQSKKEGQFPPRRRCSCGCCDDIGVRVFSTCSADDNDVTILKDIEKEDKEVMEWEKEMWDRFYSTGFWRSPSQRDNNSSLSSERFVSSVSAPDLQVLAA